jgi:ABC-type phosphate/phosphonate transport system substrate-binding protein
MSDATLLLGAVAYDPKVVTIWDGFRDWFDAHGLPFDYVLFTNYERQVDAHLRGDVHVAWNSPLAWIETERLARKRGRRAVALAMRDSDCGLKSVVLARADGPIQSLADLRGKRVAVGAADSPQSTLIPLLAIAEAGVEPGRDFAVVRHDVMLGKHGDHVGGEKDAVRALLAGSVDAACIIDANRYFFSRAGILPAETTRVVHLTEAYDHCNMTAFDDAPPAVERFRDLLLGMSYDDPEVRPLLDLEGLKVWKPGRTSGYSLLDRAVDRFGTLDDWLARR